MAASELAFGEHHMATETMQPIPTTRRMELSGEAFGDDQPGVEVPIDGCEPPLSSAECPHSDT